MTDVYQTTRNKEKTMAELDTAMKALIENDIDMILCEYFRNIEEMEWAIELVKKTTDKPCGATMCVGPNGDVDGVSLGECAVRMAKAGADLIGLNCLFGPFVMLDCMKVMKEALDKEGLKPHLMCQPLGYRVPDAGHFGWINIPEFPYALEPRQITRIEAARYARAAYEMGIRYIGGCCGFEPYHIRAMAEELMSERGFLPEASNKSEFARGMFMAKKRIEGNPKDYTGKYETFKNLTFSTFSTFMGHFRDTMEYWINLVPCTGRPLSSAMHQQKDVQCVQKAIVS